MQVIDMGKYLYVNLEKDEINRLKLALEWLELQKSPSYIPSTLIPLIEEIIDKT
jgi:hypothetical protein